MGAGRRSTRPRAARPARRGDHQERGAGRAQQLVGGVARSRKPPNIVSNACTNADTSAQHLPAEDRRAAGEQREPRPDDLAQPRPPARAGADSSRIMRPSRNFDMRCGASRKSSAERDGGVSTTIRSHRPSRRSWPSFSIAMYSCVPEKRRGQRLVEGVGQDLRGAAPASACASTISSNVRFMSSIIACSSPPALTPSTEGGVLSSTVRPIDWASRRAGSMVSTTTLRPRSAARSASAAAVVVLPTPPEPQQTMMRVSGSSSSGVDVEPGGCSRADAPGRAAPRPARTGRPGPRRRSAAAARRSGGSARQASAAALARAPALRRARRPPRPAPRSRRVGGRARPPRARRGCARRRRRPLGRRDQSTGRAASGGRTLLTNTPPGRRPRGAQLGEPSSVS